MCSGERVRSHLACDFHPHCAKVEVTRNLWELRYLVVLELATIQIDSFLPLLRGAQFAFVTDAIAAVDAIICLQ